jgi:hypothetical protein
MFGGLRLYAAYDGGLLPLATKPAASPLPPLWAGKCFMRRSIPMSESAKKGPKTTRFLKIIKAADLIKAGVFSFIIGSKPVKQL